jgi:hypothetical protein
VVLADALIEACVRNNERFASSFFVPTHQQTPVHAPSLNIYRHRFEFHPQLSTVPFLFLLYPQIIEISAAGANKARCDLLTADVNYTDLDDSDSQDDFLLSHPLHQHLFSRRTRPLLSAFLLVAMDNRRTGGVNITTLSSTIPEIMAANVVNTSSTPLDDIVSLHRS